MIHYALVLLAAGIFTTQVNTTPTLDAATANQLCLDSRIRKVAAEQIGAWSANYPFARVIIGNDGRFGDVQSPTPAVAGSNFVVCAASFSLVKSNGQGAAYRVSLDRFYFRVTRREDGYAVTLEDLPASLAGTTLTSRELINRFQIDGRPYADILAENQRRIESDRH